jgi:hypothetical protein
MGGPCVGVLRPAGSFARYANPHGPLSQIGVWGAVNGLQREIIMSTITNQLGTVSFQGRNLTVITTESGEHLVAMKPICEAIGLGWQSQYNRIRRHPVLSTSVFVMNTQIPGDDQQREITCLPLDLLNGWLFGIDASRVKPEIRDRVIQYQRECFHVLAAYWQQGQTTNPRKTHPKALPNGLTTDQQASIKALVKARVEVMPKDKQAKAAITCWSALKSKFGCTYKEINPERFTEAVSLVARVSLEGEFIPRAEGGSLGRIPVFELEILKATVHGRIDGLPNSVRRSALARIWQEIHARMGVDRYRDILPEQTAEACRIAASCDLHLNHQQYADPVEALIAARLEELPQSMRERGSRRIKSALQRRFDYRPWGSDMVLACRIVTETEIDDLCHYESGGEILDEVDIEPDATLAGMTANHFIFSSPSGVIRTIGLDKMSADSAFVTDRTSYLIGMAIGQRLN